MLMKMVKSCCSLFKHVAKQCFFQLNNVICTFFGQILWSLLMNYMVSVAIRGALLGLIVFGAVSFFPKQSVSMQNRLIISIVVVILYALLDYFKNFFVQIRSFACKLLCGCDPHQRADADAVLDDVLKDL